jgi:hypothetical protein
MMHLLVPREPDSGQALLTRARGVAVVTFDLQEVHFEPDAASKQVEALFERVRESPRTEEQPAEPREITPDLIQRLARQLSLARGEDPDDRPVPQRHPRWHYHYVRAKTLLSITSAEQQALALVLRR